MTRILLIGEPMLLAIGGAPVRIRAKEAAVCLAASAGLPRSKHQIAELLWPLAAAATARTNLRVLIFRFSARARVSIFHGRDRFRFRPDVDVDLVAAATTRLDLAQSRILLDRPLLGGMDYRGLPQFQEFLLQEQRTWSMRAYQSLAHFANELQKNPSTVAEAVTLLQQLRKVAPEDEQVARLLMAALMRLGKRAGALATYEELSRWTILTYGALPHPVTMALHREILAAADVRGGREN